MIYPSDLFLYKKHEMSTSWWSGMIPRRKQFEKEKKRNAKALALNQEINQDQRLHWTSFKGHELESFITSSSADTKLEVDDDDERKRKMAQYMGIEKEIWIEWPETGLIRKQDELAGDTKR